MKVYLLYCIDDVPYSDEAPSLIAASLDKAKIDSELTRLEAEDKFNRECYDKSIEIENMLSSKVDPTLHFQEYNRLYDLEIDKLSPEEKEYLKANQPREYLYRVDERDLI